MLGLFSQTFRHLRLTRAKPMSKAVRALKSVRLSEAPLSGIWLRQFKTARDQALAAQLLNQLKLVSGREFESAISDSLVKLQNQLNATIAVYPISKPNPRGIAGYDPFTGGIPDDAGTSPRGVGKRQQFGSEDRVGHVLMRLQEQFKIGKGASKIECVPTLKQLRTQGIRHIVLVDDVCGSGKRINDFWKYTVPKRIKSRLSYGDLKLWIVLYGITRMGYRSLERSLPRFPIPKRYRFVIATSLTCVVEVVVVALVAEAARRVTLMNEGIESGARAAYSGRRCFVKRANSADR
jgi:hypothetical protein